MYTDVGAVPQEVIEALLAVDCGWLTYDEGRDYRTGRVKQWPLECIDESSFILEIPPGGFVHRHTDNRKEYDTYHIPLRTNGSVAHLEHREGVTYYHRLKVGRMYLVDRTVEHETKNHGSTARAHFLMAQPQHWQRCLSLR